MTNKSPNTAQHSFYNQEELDQPEFRGQSKDYIICSTQRVGSNVLCELLRQAGFGVPHEYFHPRTHMLELAYRFGLINSPDESAGKIDYQQYLEIIKKYRTTPNGYFGFKAHPSQYKRLDERCEIKEYFPELRYIFLYRQDEISQAVSAVISAQTGLWTSESIQKGKAVYDTEHIKNNIYFIRKMNRQWTELFEAHNIDAHVIKYEDMISNTQEVFDGINQFLGGSSSIAVNLKDIRLKRQSNAINHEWIERFKLSI